MKDLFDFQMDRKVDSSELWHMNMFNPQTGMMTINLPEIYQGSEHCVTLCAPNQEASLKMVVENPNIYPGSILVDDDASMKEERKASVNENPREQTVRPRFKVPKVTKRIQKRLKQTDSKKERTERKKKIAGQNSQQNHHIIPKLVVNGCYAQKTTMSAIKADKKHDARYLYGGYHMQIPKKNQDVYEHIPDPQVPNPFIDKMLNQISKELDQVTARLTSTLGDLNAIDPKNQKKTFTCKICQREFKKASGLGGHTSKQHPKTANAVPVIQKQEMKGKEEKKMKEVERREERGQPGQMGSGSENREMIPE